jgi:hypothetical protein
MEPLNLAGADTSAFEAVDPGTYAAEIAKTEWKETSGNGKMPEGCPMLSIGFKITEEPFVDRWVFGQWTLPDAAYEKAEKDKSAKLKGMFVRTIMAITGDDEETVTSGNYELDIDDLIGNECVIRVGKREYPADSGEFQNDIKGVKPAGSPTTAGAGSGVL